RQWQESLLLWSGSTTDYVGFLKSYWSSKVGGETGWDKVLQDGIITPTATNVANASFNSSAVANAVNAATSGKKAGKYELVLYQKVTVG
ncbi:hypothetical protein ACO1MO_13725, partial [Staphylococcus aureus]